MKNLIIVVIIIVLVLSLVGCTIMAGGDIKTLISKLEELGYYKYADFKHIENIKSESIKADYIFGWEESGRDFAIDAEELSEGGVGGFFEVIKPFMEKQKVKMIISDENFSETGYEITVNKIKYEIFSEEDLKSKYLSVIGTCKSFSIINKLLKEAGSEERVYALYGGNDLRAVFLTKDMYELISGYKKLPEKEKPQTIYAPLVYSNAS